MSTNEIEGGEIMEDRAAYLTNAYILKFPPEVQELLQTLREMIKESAPDTKEK